MWAPDIYEGSPTPVTAFLSIAPKISISANISRLSIYGSYGATLQQIFFFCSIASMILGALAAMAQTKVKRLLAHSSIGHVGYIRTGFSCGTIEGIQALLIGIFIYASMTIDAFAIVSALRQSRVKYIADLGALAKTNPISAITFSITMFSYAGIPPLAGFCSKFYLFFAALGCGAYFLAPVGVVTSVIGRWAAGRLPRVNRVESDTSTVYSISLYESTITTRDEPWFGELKLALGVIGLPVTVRDRGRVEPREALLRGRSLAPLHSLQGSKPFFNIEGDGESGQNRLAFLIEQIQEKNHIENAPNPSPSFVEPCISVLIGSGKEEGLRHSLRRVLLLLMGGSTISYGHRHPSQGLAQDPTTCRIWFGIATAHDFESHDDITEERLFGVSSMAWIGHLVHVSIPAFRGEYVRWNNFLDVLPHPQGLGPLFTGFTKVPLPQCTFSRREEGKLSSRSLLVFPSSRKGMKPGEKEMNTLLRNEASSLFFFKALIRSCSPILMGSRLISLPLATQMFQFAKFEKSKELRLATELRYDFPIGDLWITDGISPWPFASESILPCQCQGIHPMHSFRSYLIEDIALERDTKSLPKIEREAFSVRYWSCGFFLLVDFFLRDTLVRAVNPLRQEMRASQSLELPDANNSLEGVESLFFWYKSSLLNETS
ncbi:NADH-ubiquinone oxidoreductase chain 2 [Tanacetum coccineum]